jgi:exportin-1
LVTASKTNEVLCTNNMHILLLLSEEVFDYSSVDMTQEKIREMKTSLAREIGQIFELCFFVMENSQSAPLLTTTLEALLRYLSWIPVHFVMESTLIEILVLKYFPLSLFQNVALQCLGEIANLKFDEHPKCNEYTLKFHQAFVSIMDRYCLPSLTYTFIE